MVHGGLAGGLVGIGGTIQESYASVAVTTSDRGYAGGLVGSAYKVSNSYSTGAVQGGLYVGELLGLQWSDVDLELGRLRIERSLEESKTGLRLKSPKTKKGRRQIALPSAAVVELRSHWKEQQEGRLALGLGKSKPGDLVFPTLEGGLRRPSTLTHAWSALETGVTFHALRHTHVSMLIAGGLDVLTISRRIGHASASITLDIYGHLFGSKDGEAARVVDSVLSGGNPVAIPALLQSGEALSI